MAFQPVDVGGVYIYRGDAGGVNSQVGSDVVVACRVDAIDLAELLLAHIAAQQGAVFENAAGDDRPDIVELHQVERVGGVQFKRQSLPGVSVILNFEIRNSKIGILLECLIV